jgi:hypothetical protein
MMGLSYGSFPQMLGMKSMELNRPVFTQQMKLHAEDASSLCAWLLEHSVRVP